MEDLESERRIYSAPNVPALVSKQGGLGAVREAVVQAWQRTFLRAGGVEEGGTKPMELAAFRRRVLMETYALFDLSVDAGERTDLALTPIGADTIAALRMVLEESVREAVEPCYGHQANCSATQYPQGNAWMPFLETKHRGNEGERDWE
jgi:hypothetical protein